MYLNLELNRDDITTNDSGNEEVAPVEDLGRAIFYT
jgi:hypothetical protein